MNKIIITGSVIAIIGMTFAIIMLRRNLGANNPAEVQNSVTQAFSAGFATAPKPNNAASAAPDINEVLNAVTAHFPTVITTYVYSESNDPNGTIGKPGYYVAGGALKDKRANDGFADANNK